LPTFLSLTSRHEAPPGSVQRILSSSVWNAFESGNNEILATWGEGNDPNASVFGALDPADQALRDEAIDKDTDRAWGQIDDWADRIDGQRPIVQQEFQHAEIRQPSPVSSIPAAAYLVRARIAFIITIPEVVCPLNGSGHKKI